LGADSHYGRRSAAAFGSGEKISQQVKCFERAALREIAELKALGKTAP
jgi:biotin operon repressor